MTGSEFVGGAAAASKVVGKAMSTTAAEGEKLAEIAEGSPAMAAAAEAYARRLAVKQAILLRVFRPLARLIGIQREYFDLAFSEDLAQKTRNIPDDDIVSPPPSVAVPAMQGLGYSLDEPDLKDMYLTLLATATDGRRPGEAHPSFAEIIKQLSPAEAEVLIDVIALGGVALFQVRDRRGLDQGYRLLRRAVPSLWDLRENQWFTPPELPMWIDNWVRLGLVEIDFSVHVTEPGAYDWVEDHPWCKGYISEALDGPVSARGLLMITDFGQHFRRAVTDKSVMLTTRVGAPPPRSSDD